jgi:hypothetical protein
MAVDVIRRGESAPDQGIANLTLGYWPEDKLGMLTDVGVKNSYNKGEKLKAYYIDEKHLISSQPDADEVYLASANFPRILESAKNVIQGMFNTADLKVDILPEAIVTAAPLYRNTHDSEVLLSDSHAHELPSEEKALAFNLIGYLNKQLDIRLASVLDAAIVGELLAINRAHNVPFPENKLSKQKADQLIQIGHDRYVGIVNKNDVVCRSGKSLAIYINGMLNDKVTKNGSMKLSLIFAHDENISSILNLLDKPATSKPAYNAALRLELYQDAKGMHFIKVLMNDKTIPVCESHEYCSYSEFAQKLDANINSKCS